VDAELGVVLAKAVNGYVGGAVIMTNFYVQAFRDSPVATNRAAYPLVVYSCGGGVYRQDNSALAVELASHGFVVVSADHEDNGVIRVPGGSIVTGKLASDSIPTYQSRFKDGQVLLDQLAEMNVSDPVLGGHIDLERVGVAGWSTGGVNAAQLCLEEARVKAAVLLDPGLISYVPDLLKTGIAKPFLVITGVLADGKSLFDKASGPAYWLHISGSVHLNMGDPLLFLGGRNDRRISQVLRAYALSAFNKWLFQDDDHLLDGPSPLYPEVGTILRK
jgi:dienelactone hydrolase